jgi:membrane protein DedA with SNARE-associated domain
LTDIFLALLPTWGPVLLLVATFLSCLALPIPASLMMLAAGAFAAGGDLVLSSCIAGAFAGAVAGDQTGFLIGRGGGRLLPRLTAGSPARSRLLERARAFADRRGRLGVFLSRWLFSPLGPYVNLIGGATGMGWWGFTLAGVAGEAVWVTVYVMAGYAFADRIDTLAALAGNLSGAVTAGAVALALGVVLIRALRRDRARQSRPDADESADESAG